MNISEVNGLNLKRIAEKYLKRMFARVTKLPESKLASDKSFEEFGIDSVSSMSITSELEKDFGDLSKTLLFEYQSIAALSGFFSESYADRLIELNGGSQLTAHQEKPHAPSQIPKAVFYTEADYKSRFVSNGSRTNRGEQCDIAIIGMACRFPKANDVESFWKIISDGVDCITEVPSNRWDHSRYYDKRKGITGKTYSKWGGFIENAECFDPMFFGITSNEALVMDPQERVFLETVWNTLEDAGYTRRQLWGQQIGVYVGVMWNQYQLYKLNVNGNSISPTGSYGSIANRISYYFNLVGGSMAVDTMCSSALSALYVACNALNNGDISSAIVGGVNLNLHPNKYAIISQQKFASSDGRCRSFGEGGDGYVPGEGVGALLIKRLDDAKRDGDRIYAVIKGISVNHGGKTSGFTVPNQSAQTEVIDSALKQSGIDPRTIGVVEAHGTGTALGDPIEINALTKAYRRYTKDCGYCSIGSVKSNIGHLESASGMAAIIKVILQMKHRKLVPSLHSERLNPNIDFDNSPFHVQHLLEEWKPVTVKKEDGQMYEVPLRAGLSSFGAGGTNVHVIMEDYDTDDSSVSQFVPNDQPAVFTLSARTEERLHAWCELLLGQLECSSDSVYEIAYSLQMHREPMEYRTAFTVCSMKEAIEKLKRLLSNDIGHGIFTGNIHDISERARLIGDGEEGQKFVNSILQSGRLEDTAALWAEGMDVDWSVLYPKGYPKRVSIPAYPFLEERFWLPDKINSSDTNSNQASLMPMIDSNISDIDGLKYKKRLSGSEYYIADHRINGVPVMPGAAQVELAAEAAVLSLGGRRLTALNDIQWRNMLHFDNDPIELYVSISNREGTLYCNLCSDANESDSTVFASMKFEYDTSLVSDAVVDVAAWCECCTQTVSGEQCYEHSRKNGFEYGESMRCIKRLSANNECAMAEIALPDSLYENFERYLLHPSVLDSVFQCTMAVFSEEAKQTMQVPCMVERIEMIAPLERKCFVFINRKKSDSSMTKTDIIVTACDGRVLLNIIGLTTIAINEKKSGPDTELLELLEQLRKGEVDAATILDLLDN